MYQYDDYDRALVFERVAQFRDQVERFMAGELSEEEFLPLRLQNGLYLQKHAYMLRVAIPYGTLSAEQMRTLASIAADYDRGYGHFTTRQNLQFNWIELAKVPDILERLAQVNMHAIQTSGNCVRNITTEAFAGVAADELIDPRPLAEILRQWSTINPEFLFLPRKFKIAICSAKQDRAAIMMHDIGLYLYPGRDGQMLLRVIVGGGLGRTPILGVQIREGLPWQHLLSYVEAILRVYNRHGRRDNKYKARIKILVKTEGQRYIDEVEEEFRQIVEHDGAPHTIPAAEFDRIAASFVPPRIKARAIDVQDASARLSGYASRHPAFARWLARNVAPHRDPALRIVTLSFKRRFQAPGDASPDQLDALADLADRFSAGEARVTHTQNVVLPWVHVDDLFLLWEAARGLGLASANVGLLTDMIACPGGDFCALANARSIPIADAIAERFQDLDMLHDIGDIDLHISGCINSCGHHHSGHIGILGVDKDGAEWYQVTLGGYDGSAAGGPAQPGKVIGPSFSADEIVDVVDALVVTYLDGRLDLAGRSERFINTVRRIGPEPFKAAAQQARHLAANA